MVGSVIVLPKPKQNELEKNYSPHKRIQRRFSRQETLGIGMPEQKSSDYCKHIGDVKKQHDAYLSNGIESVSQKMTQKEIIKLTRN